VGPVLPPPQGELEGAYRSHLGERYGIRFNALYVLTNMPIQRFGSTLVSKGGFDAYIALLRSAYQSANLESLMCRSLVSIDWQGYVYDCDFNQMLGLPLASQGRGRSHVRAQHLFGTGPQRQVNQADDAHGHPRRPVGAARRHGGDAIDELGLAQRTQLLGSLGTIAGRAFDEDRTFDVVAAAGVGQQVRQQIAMRGKIPQVMVRIDDCQIGFEYFLAYLRQVFNVPA
jgi:hypothetical protein